ncbi:hypothetical protein VTL71DRAFT_16384 [Oculimacula yallundae]|uniref:Uncharacterized protein n=1 Tax=Oculimacula yallundae TaxID=86028 RepID=A0ABR4CFL1_9HELO
MARSKKKGARKGKALKLARNSPAKLLGNGKSEDVDFGNNAGKTVDPTATTYTMPGEDIIQDSNPLHPPKETSKSGDPEAGTTYTVAVEKKKPTLLTLPEEVRQRIWKYAVKEEEPITPYQVAPKSNKFFWNIAQVNAAEASEASTLPDSTLPGSTLTAVALGKVCKQVYLEVTLGHIFYHVNHFDFTLYDMYENHLRAYMIAITSNRRNEIKSMSFVVFQVEMTFNYQCLNLIASCKGLQCLELRFIAWKNDFNQSHGVNDKHRLSYKLLIAAVQGVKELHHIISPDYFTDSDEYAKMKAVFETFKTDAASSLAELRTGDFDRKLFELSRVRAGLDVEGEGRISGDRKPGVVASRTRSGIAAYKAISADGVLPIRENPKYDLNGILAWDIEKILKCREVPTDKGGSGVELQIKLWTGSSSVTSWEDCLVLQPNEWDEVVDFFRAYPYSPGLQAIHDILKAEKSSGFEDDEEDPGRVYMLYMRQVHLMSLKHLIVSRASMTEEDLKDAACYYESLKKYREDHQ